MNGLLEFDVDDKTIRHNNYIWKEYFHRIHR